MERRLKKGEKHSQRLDTWKEISSYLRRDVRTCQRWEKEFDLPVCRLNQSSKSRVFCYTHEIDDWIKEKSQKIINRDDPQNQKSIKRTWIFSALFMALIISLFFLLSSLPHRSVEDNPVDFRIFGSKLVILDDQNKILGEFDTGLKNLEDENHYRTLFMNKRVIDEVYYLPRLIIRDINNDKKNELLFTYCTKDNSKEDILICLSGSGDKLWEYIFGKKATFGDVTYTDEYRIKSIDCLDFNKDGNWEIIVLVNHSQSFPGRAVVLDSDGLLLGEFWNSGHIYDYDFYDVNDDGINEIFLAGFNAERGKSCCIVLDFSKFNGHSPQKLDQFKYKGLGDDKFMHYILFPSLGLNDEMSFSSPLARLVISRNPDKLVKFESLINYSLNHKLELKEIEFSMRFKAEYGTWVRDGKIDRSLAQLIQDMIDDGLEYWEGMDWSKKRPESFFDNLD